MSALAHRRFLKMHGAGNDFVVLDLRGTAITVEPEEARAIAAEGHVGLVETFADRLAAACLQDERVRRATVRIDKPGALGGHASPGCEVVLSR